ncbi:hypothetical protein JCGZ_18894 [Jatropha curcas]|uniref:Uncharacterized protein n=1 Tax=Jatropha curcas TaxID=180498 RepID=A0A067K7M5_JATCU|nr:late embryogenesis abundant protein Lea5 [Jatropha curcas]KDP27814.1 hypothetical protein JCGZ_18894 [Jatropha curcas]
MTRSLSTAKFLVASIVEDLPLSIFRRGYAGAAHGSESASFGRRGSRTSIVGKVEERAATKEDDSGSSTAWAPDPITGYYRPANSAAEIDPAELREMLLHNRVRPR